MKLNYAGLVAFLLINGANVSQAVQIVTGDAPTACEEFQLLKELRVYKDPAVLLNNVSIMKVDAETAWDSMADESPVLTQLSGRVQLMRLGPPDAFQNFGAVARAYEAAIPRLKLRSNVDKSAMIVPVRICGEHQAYSDSLGFVFLSELTDAQIDEGQRGRLPPSTLKNPIPRLPVIPVEVVQAKD